MTDSGVRLCEVLAAISMATDLGLGQPSEHMVRSACLSMRIGERLGLDSAQLATLYDVSLLTYVGCPVYGNEAAMLFGDDIDFRAGTYGVDLGTFSGMGYMIRSAGRGSALPTKLLRKGQFVATGGRGVVEQMANHCSAAGLLAERLKLTPDVRQGVELSYARWDGKGVPGEMSGDELPLAARVSHVAEAFEVLTRTAGFDEALDIVRGRSGTHFDPGVVAALDGLSAELAHDQDEHSLDELLDKEPIDRPRLTDEELDEALAALGDFCDLRIPCFAGHARGTAELASAAAASMQVPESETRVLRRAAHIHDVGRFGVAGDILSKPGPLNSAETERVRVHTYFVERIFSRPDPLRRVGLVAATHHERMDGSGYHRSVGGVMLTIPSRLLAVADAYHAMTQVRPHRSALTPDDAARAIRAEVRDGRFDPTAAEAVLEAAGHRGSRSRGGSAGLTARESEVLALLASGLPNKGIARQLGISPKTVGNHVEHVYTKLGVTNRAGAALLAMQHGLVGSGGAPT
ncbi:MAG TPA: HD domain-containing phosphohydrolase [Acidimicrobiales bacterium]|nr:HD domain-containing phosphohydrolase [Acidimicrobiales bacterium]